MVHQDTRPATYREPPLVEVAISVEFGPPVGANQAHLGAFWAEQKEQFPVVHTAPPVRSTREEFTGKGPWLPPSLQFQLSNEPALRLQLTSRDDQWMCQIQLDRLIVNWRKRTGDYPRFADAWVQFKEAWESWLSYLDKVALPHPTPNSWEITYVNQISRSKKWSSPSEWPSLLPGLWAENFMPAETAKLVGMRGQWVWEHATPPARLYADAKPGRFGKPPQDTVVLTLTARGPIDFPGGDNLPEKASMISAIEAGVNCGHLLILTAFEGITSDDAKNAWLRDPGSK